MQLIKVERDKDRLETRATQLACMYGRMYLCAYIVPSQGFTGKQDQPARMQAQSSFIKLECGGGGVGGKRWNSSMMSRSGRRET